MKLWRLRPHVHILAIANNADNPWRPWWNTSRGFIVRAATEQEARQLVHEYEYSDHPSLDVEIGKEMKGGRNVWLDPYYTCCIELTKQGGPGVLMRDFWAA